MRARAIATRIIAPVDEEDRLPDAMEQEAAADRAELAHLCGKLAKMDVPIETGEQRVRMQSHQHAIDAITCLPDNAVVEAITVNGEVIPTDPLAAAARYGVVLGPGRAIDQDDEDEARPDGEEEV